jgi:hypothetical protein
MTLAPLPPPDRRVEADDVRAVLDAAVQRALGPLVGRAACDVDELAVVFPTWGRSTRYEAVRAGVIPSITVGRRRVIPIPGLVVVLLGHTNDGDHKVSRQPSG